MLNKRSNFWPLKFVLIKNSNYIVLCMFAYMYKIYILKYDHLNWIGKKQNSLKNINLELWETGIH